MLARVAENMYWMARYLERAEDMARLINVNAHLLLDLPRGIAPGWRPLVTMVGADARFVEKHGTAEDESRILRFLIGDRDNPQSVLVSIRNARENARTFRDAIPREAWEEINALHLFAREELNTGLSKRGRFGYLKEIIRRCQTVSGLLAGCMNRDEGYAFLRIGRSLERADMTSRILDVRTAGLLAPELAEYRAFDNIQWMSVLKSLTGYQMYRLEMQVRVRGADVAQFLLRSRQFPRAVCWCLDVLEAQLEALGSGDQALRQVQDLRDDLLAAELQGPSAAVLHAFIDQLQVGFGRIHQALDDSFFLTSRRALLAAAAAQTGLEEPHPTP